MPDTREKWSGFPCQIIFRLHTLNPCGTMLFNKISAKSIASDNTVKKAFYAFVQNKLHYAVTGKTAAELISERATLDSPTMGLTTWKGAPDGKILKSDTLVAKNYLNEKDLSRLNRLVSMFIDYAELMAEDEQLMRMQDWLNETDRFLTNNRRKVLDGKGHISREAAAKKVGAVYDEFRKKQDAAYISDFDREMAKYLKGGKPT